MDLKFAVVHFFESDEVEVAPVSWTFLKDEKTRCFWPSFKNRERVRVAVKQEVPPMESLWQSYEVRIMHKFRTFEDALAKVPHFFEFSDLSEAEGTPAAVNTTEFSKWGRPLKKTRLDFGREAFKAKKPPVSDANTSVTLHVPEFPESPNRFESHVFSADLEGDDDSSDVTIGNVHGVTPSITEIVFPTPLPSFTQEFAAEFKEFQNICLCNFGTIQANQSTSMRMMEAILYNSKASNSQASAAVENRPKFWFPFRALEGLMDFDRRIGSDEEFRAACMKYLGTIGGADLTTAVFEPLKKLMTYEVAYMFNFTGINGKANFSALNLNDLILDLVRANPSTAHETMVNVRNKIKNCVLHAGDKLPKEMTRLRHSNDEGEQANA